MGIWITLSLTMVELLTLRALKFVRCGPIISDSKTFKLWPHEFYTVSWCIPYWMMNMVPYRVVPVLYSKLLFPLQLLCDESFFEKFWLEVIVWLNYCWFLIIYYNIYKHCGTNWIHNLTKFFGIQFWFLRIFYSKH